MYDAYAGVRGNPSDLPPYLPGLPPAPDNASPQAAVAAAAYETLKSLFPSQTAFFDSKLAELGNPSNPAHDLECKSLRQFLPIEQAIREPTPMATPLRPIVSAIVPTPTIPVKVLMRRFTEPSQRGLLSGGDKRPKSQIPREFDMFGSRAKYQAS